MPKLGIKFKVGDKVQVIPRDMVLKSYRGSKSKEVFVQRLFKNRIAIIGRIINRGKFPIFLEKNEEYSYNQYELKLIERK